MSPRRRPTSDTVPPDVLIARPWRVGRSTGRAIYCGEGDDDVVGMMDTRELAAHVVACHNGIERLAAWLLAHHAEEIGYVAHEGAVDLAIRLLGRAR